VIRLSAANISKCYFLNKKKLSRIVKFILRYTGIKDANLSVVFVSQKEIRRLNYLYRKRKSPTDVLSFSMREGKRLKRDSLVLGDVIISPDCARSQAKRFNSTFKKEIYLYVVHGILHLLGYDDEKASSRKIMRKKEREILKALFRSGLL